LATISFILNHLTPCARFEVFTAVNYSSQVLGCDFIVVLRYDTNISEDLAT